jgi:hypothetical protein
MTFAALPFNPAAANSAAARTPIISFVNRRQFMIEWGNCDPASNLRESLYVIYSTNREVSSCGQRG